MFFLKSSLREVTLSIDLRICQTMPFFRGGSLTLIAIWQNLVYLKENNVFLHRVNNRTSLGLSKNTGLRPKDNSNIDQFNDSKKF